MLSAILGRRLASPQAISVSDISQPRRQYLEEKYQVLVTGDSRLALVRGEVVILAVKPQNIAEVMAELCGQLKSTQLVLSIVAGVDIGRLCFGLEHDRVVRAMPNTPAQIGEGMTVWTASGEVTKQQRRWASSILGAMGKETYVDDERYLDMATAVSGSGPAYFFFFVEALVQAAVGIGLPVAIAEELVLQTMLGSGHLIQKSSKAPAELRRMVTSPGGTTAEALRELERGDFAGLVARAVNAAYDRARRLGGRQ